MEVSQMTTAMLVRREPVLLAHVGLTTVTVGGLAFLPGVHLTPAEMAAAATIMVALTSVIPAFLATPVNVGVIHAGITTILVAAAAFGLRLSTPDIAVVTTAITAVLGYLLREKLTPVAGTNP